MTKGRSFMPTSANEGNWFRHRGEPGDPEGRLRDMTSTRAMLTAPFSAPAGPRTPPELFIQKDKEILKQNYPFTQHDNRHYFQEHGVYLGNGRDTRHLGRRLHSVDHRLHHTDHGFLHHQSRYPTLHDYNPTTATSYRTPGPTEKPSARRFPRVYKNPENSELTTTTTMWSNSPHKTPMQVLASAQEPFLGHNTWKYSNHGLTRIYPSYKRKPNPPVSNVLDRYGSNFASLPVVPPPPAAACLSSQE